MTMGWLCGMHTTDNSQQIKFNQWPNQPIFIYQMNNISEKMYYGAVKVTRNGGVTSTQHSAKTTIYMYIP